MARNFNESEGKKINKFLDPSLHPQQKIMGLFLDRDSIQIFVEIISDGFCVILLTSQPTTHPSKKPTDEHMKHKPPW